MPAPISSADAALGHVDVGGQRRAAEHAQVDLGHDVAADARCLGDPPRRLQLDRVALAVPEAERVRHEALALRDRQHRRRVQPSAEQDNCVLFTHPPSDYDGSDAQQTISPAGGRIERCRARRRPRDDGRRVDAGHPGGVLAEGLAGLGRALRGEARPDRRTGPQGALELPRRGARRQARRRVVLQRHGAGHDAERLLRDQVRARARSSGSRRTTATCASASAQRSGSRSGGARRRRPSRCATC